MRTLRLMPLLTILVVACGGRRAAREPSAAIDDVPPVAMKCGAFNVSVPGGGTKSYDNEGNVIVEWSDRKAHLQLPSDAPSKSAAPPIVYDESTGSPAPEGDPAPPEPKNPKAERRAIEKVIEAKLREKQCEFTKDVRPEVTWYACELFAKNGRVRLIASVSEGDMCLAVCASLSSDPRATATCDAIAPLQ